MPSSSTTIVSKCTIRLDQKSKIKLFRPPHALLLVHSKGCPRHSPSIFNHPFYSLLRQSLSVTLSHFPALAGRLSTNSDSHISILCNDAGVDFIHAKATFLSVNSLLSAINVPDSFKEFFAFLASFRSFFPAFGLFSAAPS